jgi:hypothetical protein
VGELVGGLVGASRWGHWLGIDGSIGGRIGGGLGGSPDGNIVVGTLVEAALVGPWWAPWCVHRRGLGGTKREERERKKERALC